MLQHRGLVQGDVIGLVALDFILRLVGCSMVDVAFVIDVPFMDFDDFSAHAPGFRIPAHVIANLERLDQRSVLVRSSVQAVDFGIAESEHEAPLLRRRLKVGGVTLGHIAQGVAVPRRPVDAAHVFEGLERVRKTRSHAFCRKWPSVRHP